MYKSVLYGDYYEIKEKIKSVKILKIKKKVIDFLLFIYFLLLLQTNK